MLELYVFNLFIAFFIVLLNILELNLSYYTCNVYKEHETITNSIVKEKEMLIKVCSRPIFFEIDE